MQKLQKREVRLNRQEFLTKVRDIAGDDAHALRSALKALAVDRTPAGTPTGGGQAAAPGAAPPPLDFGRPSAAAALGGVVPAAGAR